MLILQLEYLMQACEYSPATRSSPEDQTELPSRPATALEDLIDVLATILICCFQILKFLSEILDIGL